MSDNLILIFDVGTTGTRSVIYDIKGNEVGRSYEEMFTTVLLLDDSLDIKGVRQKIIPFKGEDVFPSLRLEAFRLNDGRILGIVVCKEVLNTAIAEIYRMMEVDALAVTIGNGHFWGLQRESWIDQMELFSDIANASLVCACGATKDEGGLNLKLKND